MLPLSGSVQPARKRLGGLVPSFPGPLWMRLGGASYTHSQTPPWKPCVHEHILLGFSFLAFARPLPHPVSWNHTPDQRLHPGPNLRVCWDSGKVRQGERNSNDDVLRLC